jgi:hypothetical protein
VSASSDGFEDLDVIPFAQTVRFECRARHYVAIDRDGHALLLETQGLE